MRWMILSLAACTAEPPRLYSVPVTADPVDGPTWTTADGVAITLTEATLTFADLRLYTPPAAIVVWPSLVPTASAHPGAALRGETAGELLGTWTVDLLGGPVQLGSASCYLGAFATASLQLAGALTLHGAATPATGEPVAFTFDTTLSDVAEDLLFETTLTPDSALILSVHAAALLSHVDWSTAPVETALTLNDGALGNVVAFGARSADTWTLAVSP